MKKISLKILQKVFTSVFVFGYVFSLATPAFASNHKPTLWFDKDVSHSQTASDEIKIKIDDHNEDDIVPASLTYVFISSSASCSSSAFGVGSVQTAYTPNVSFYINTPEHNGQYICARVSDNLSASDQSNHTDYERSDDPLNIEDNQAPTGSLVVNTNATYTNSQNVTLTLSATDFSGVSKMKISNTNSFSGDWINYATSKTWTLTSGEGTKSVFVIYKDGEGNISSTYSDSIILDQHVDSVTANSLTTDDTTPTLTGTASDILSGIASVKVSFEGTDYTATYNNTLNTWYWDEPTSLVDGDYTFFATALDNAGNSLKSSEAILTIHTDHVAPIVNVISPIGLYQSVSDVTVTASDSDSGVRNVAMHIYQVNQDATLTLLCTSIPATFDGTNWIADITSCNLTDGTYQIAAWAYDNAGNPGWAPRVNFTLDSTTPSVPTNGLPNGTYTTTNNFDFTWDASTDASGITYEFQSTMTPTEVGGVLTTNLWHSGVLPTNMIHSSGAPDGTWYWQVRALDAAGNYSNWSSIWTVTLDTQAPATPVLVSPVDGAFINGASVTNAWSDTSTDISHFVYESYHDQALTNLRWTENFTSTSKTATSVGDASFWWRVKAVDFAGNESAWSPAWKVTVDNIVPVTSFVGDISNSDFNSPIYLQGSSSDVNGLSAVNLYFRNSDLSSDWTLIDTINNTSGLLPFTWSYTWTPPYQGTFDIKASGVDLAGNTEHSPMMSNITYDTTLPAIGDVNIVVDYLSKYVNGQTGFLISVPVNDSLSGIDNTSCMYTIDGTTWSYGMLVNNRCAFGVLSSQLFDNDGLEISAKVKDNSGNAAVSNIVERKVDKALPQSQTIIDNPFYGPNSLPLVKGVASDTVSEITNVMVTLKRSSNNRYWLIGNVWTVVPMMHNVSGNENWTLTKTLPSLQNGVTYTFTPYAWDQVHTLPGTGIADSFIWDNQLPQDPTSFVASHSLSTPKNDNTIDISFSGASDAISGVAGYYYSFSNTPETPTISPSNWLPVGTTNVTSPVLSDGIWYFNIRTLDNAGNITSTAHYGSLIVDTTSPDVDITSPASIHLSGTVEVRGTVTDANPHHYWFVIVNSTGAQVAGLNTVNDATSFTDKLLLNWNTTSLADGRYTIKLEARDAANNKDAGSVEWLTVNVDNTAPTVDLVFDTPSPSATGFKAVFSEPMNEADATNPANHFLNNWPTAGGTGDLLGDASITYDSETNTATVTFLNAGWYLSPEQQWGVQNVHDLAGNIMSVTPYTEYTTPMVAPVTTASGIDSLWHNTDVTVTLTCTDIDGSGCYLTHYSVNGGTEQIGNTVTVSEEGLNTITFYSEDMAGNVETVQTSEVVKIDKTNPLAQVLAATTFTTGDTTPRSLALSDNTELSQVCYVIDTNTQTCLPLFGTGYSWDITALINTLSVGTHIFTYYVVDTAGNRSDSNTIIEGNDPYAASVVVADIPAVQGAATVAEVTPEAVQGEQTTEEETTSPVTQEEVKGTQDTTDEETNGKPIPWWVYVLGGTALLSFIIFLIARRRKEEEEKEKNIR